jgi:hypothetical protein
MARVSSDAGLHDTDTLQLETYGHFQCGCDQIEEIRADTASPFGVADIFWGVLADCFVSRNAAGPCRLFALFRHAGER